MYLNLKQFPILNDVLVSRKKKKKKSFLIRLPLAVTKEIRFFLLQFGNNTKVCKDCHTNTLYNFQPDSSPLQSFLFLYEMTLLSLPLAIKVFIQCFTRIPADYTNTIYPVKRKTLLLSLTRWGKNWLKDRFKEKMQVSEWQFKQNLDS